jgi:hypothetical protein
MLFREIITLYSDNNTKVINAARGQSAQILIIKANVPVVGTVL